MSARMYTMKSRLTLEQGKTGYRYNIDSFALADFYNKFSAKRIIDLGAGAGALSIPIAHVNPGIEVFGLEITHEYSHQAKENAKSSKIANYHAITGDILNAVNIFGNEKFDAVASNPPYTKRGAGRLCTDPRKKVARHEIRITLAELLEVSAKLLNKGGSLFISMAHSRRDEFLYLLAQNGFYETRLRKVTPLPDSPPKIFLSEATFKIKTPFHEETPLLLRSPEGGDSQEAKRIAIKYA